MLVNGVCRGGDCRRYLCANCSTSKHNSTCNDRELSFQDDSRGENVFKLAYLFSKFEMSLAAAATVLVLDYVCSWMKVKRSRQVSAH